MVPRALRFLAVKVDRGQPMAVGALVQMDGAEIELRTVAGTPCGVEAGAPPSVALMLPPLQLVDRHQFRFD
jgi:hypothetical protein